MVLPRHLVLSSSPVWLPYKGKSGHWKDRVLLLRGLTIRLRGMNAANVLSNRLSCDLLHLVDKVATGCRRR